ncbi:MAG: dienelactone hydrolase family protein [Hyphomicrobiales bacterium]|nr:dienelactone hydrolase family protein [Hyphomicrobiales bacterium]
MSTTGLCVAQTLELPFTLTMPAGRGPFPAVVLLHDCSGLGPRSSGSPWRWSARLAAEGYVTIWPDSFSTRGHAGGVCTEAGQPRNILEQRAEDAYAALAHLRTSPQVDPRRIAVMGGSHGGSATLATIVDNAANRRHKESRFAAAAALYPGCARNFGDWSVTRNREARHKITGYSGVFKPLAPLLILAGELDDWTPAEPCRRLAAAARQSGYDVNIVVYPEAHHAFDSLAPLRYMAERVNINAPSGRGATTGGNEAAWADAVIQVKAFLAKHLPAKER